jgi:hypothetical protein
LLGGKEVSWISILVITQTRTTAMNDRNFDDDALSPGRGSSAARIDEYRDRDDERHDARKRSDPRDRDEDRWPDRNRDPRDRDSDPRDVFTHGLNLPRERDREIVHDSRGREYTLRG